MNDLTEHPRGKEKEFLWRVVSMLYILNPSSQKEDESSSKFPVSSENNLAKA
jgi:hypothetical protein